MCSKYESHYSVNNQLNIGGGGLVWPFNEDKNLYFHNEQDNDTSSDNYEKNYYNLDLDLLTMLY
jgi:hypothetical protein